MQFGMDTVLSLGGYNVLLCWYSDERIIAVFLDNALFPFLSVKFLSTSFHKSKNLILALPYFLL